MCHLGYGFHRDSHIHHTEQLNPCPTYTCSSLASKVVIQLAGCPSKMGPFKDHLCTTACLTSLRTS